jgi:hypothetical protein
MIKTQASLSKGWLNKHGAFTFPTQYYHDPIFRLEEDRKINGFVRENFLILPFITWKVTLSRQNM